MRRSDCTSTAEKQCSNCTDTSFAHASIIRFVCKTHAKVVVLGEMLKIISPQDEYSEAMIEPFEVVVTQN